MAGKRTPLGGLGQRLAQKPVAQPVEPVQQVQEAASAPRPDRQPDGRKGILVRARPEAWKGLKLVALDREITLQDLMIEAINDVLEKHGKSPTA